MKTFLKGFAAGLRDVLIAVLALAVIAGFVFGCSILGGLIGSHWDTDPWYGGSDTWATVGLTIGLIVGIILVIAVGIGFEEWVKGKERRSR